MKIRFIRTIFLVLLLSAALASCGMSRFEYEVISVAKYEVVVGADENGPVTANRLTFTYLKDGIPIFIRKFVDDGKFDYILLGDKNLYVIVSRPGTTDLRYLYLTQETYNKLFPEKENAEEIESVEQETISNSKEETTNDNSEHPDPDQDH